MSTGNLISLPDENARHFPGELTADANPEDLSPGDADRYFWYVRSFWHGMQGNYRQWALGSLPDEEWRYYGRVICAGYKTPGVYAQWPIERELLIPAFVQVVETCDPPNED